MNHPDLPMPTTNPRLSITLQHADLAVLDRYCNASGTPRATLVAELIKSTIPQLLEAAELIELANAAPRKVKQDLVDNLSNATADAMGFFQPFNRDYQSVMDRLQFELVPDPPMGKRAGKGGTRLRGAPVRPTPGGASDPHSLTGGSKS